jgi:hypothetical protein
MSARSAGPRARKALAHAREKPLGLLEKYPLIPLSLGEAG